MKNLILIIILLFLSACATTKEKDFKLQKWPNGEISYFFDQDIKEKDKKVVIEIFNTIEKKTKCIYFINDLENPKSVYIQYSEKDYYYATMGYNDNNTIAIMDRERIQPYKIMHEIFHVLGMVHEHQRPDRDSYVIINFENIKDDMLFCFNVVNIFLYDLNKYSYDINSIMHYRDNYFSKNLKPTIEFIEERNNLSGPTKLDWEKLISIYAENK